jgi:hypothetical protein
MRYCGELYYAHLFSARGTAIIAIKEALFVDVLEQLALRHMAESAMLALRDTPMDSQATLEHALLVCAQATIENIMQPDYGADAPAHC